MRAIIGIRHAGAKWAALFGATASQGSVRVLVLLAGGMTPEGRLPDLAARVDPPLRWTDGLIQIQFRISHPQAPAALKLFPDVRLLGLKRCAWSRSSLAR